MVSRRCSVLDCLSQEGRTFTEVEGEWEVALCLLCGSNGAHSKCGDIRDAAKYTCFDCGGEKAPQLEVRSPPKILSRNLEASISSLLDTPLESALNSTIDCSLNPTMDTSSSDTWILSVKMPMMPMYLSETMPMTL